MVYVGHSAGGLAAVIAGESDSKTLAVIGLDLTDADEIGVGASRNLSAPLYGLLGEPSSCNASGNGLAVYEQASMALAFRVSDADHSRRRSRRSPFVNPVGPTRDRSQPFGA